MSTIIRAATAADFLSLVPALLGFTPVRSLVLVPFAGGRSLGGLRADLPGDADTGELDQTASTLIGMVCKVARVDGVAAIVYTDRTLGDGVELPERALVDAVLSRAHICGLRVVDALVVGADAWESYLDTPRPGGRPLHDLAVPASSEVDRAVERDQFAAAELPTAGVVTTERVGRMLADLRAVLDADESAADVPERRLRAACVVLDLLQDPPDLFESVLEGDADTLEVPRLAAVVLALSRPLLRDVALAQWAADIATGDAVFRAQTRFAEGEPFPEDLAHVMLGEGPAPEPARLRHALELCRRAAAAAPRDDRPGALASAAWLSWAMGRSTHAGEYATRALSIDPDHGLSGIVMTMIAQGRLPEWAFTRVGEADGEATSRGGRGSSRGSRAR